MSEVHLSFSGFIVADSNNLNTLVSSVFEFECCIAANSTSFGNIISLLRSSLC